MYSDNTSIKKTYSKKLVFIVEDNRAYCILLGRVLEKKGFMIMMFESGKKALNMMDYITPDLILSDIQMPEMDGFNLHAEVFKRHHDLHVPFIYISSCRTRSIVKKANRIGATKMIDKPVTPTVLQQKITQVLSA